MGPGSMRLAPNDHFTLAVNGDRITGPLVDAAQAALPARVNLPDINFKFTIGAGPFTVDVVNCTVHSRVSLGGKLGGADSGFSILLRSGAGSPAAHHSRACRHLVDQSSPVLFSIARQADST